MAYFMRFAQIVLFLVVTDCLNHIIIFTGGCMGMEIQFGTNKMVSMSMLIKKF